MRTLDYRRWEPEVRLSRLAVLAVLVASLGFPFISHAVARLLENCCGDSDARRMMGHLADVVPSVLGLTLGAAAYVRIRLSSGRLLGIWVAAAAMVMSALWLAFFWAIAGFNVAQPT